jgi:hypothetical protein
VENRKATGRSAKALPRINADDRGSGKQANLTTDKTDWTDQEKAKVCHGGAEIRRKSGKNLTTDAR